MDRRLQVDRSVSNCHRDEELKIRILKEEKGADARRRQRWKWTRMMRGTLENDWEWCIEWIENTGKMREKRHCRRIGKRIWRGWTAKILQYDSGCWPRFWKFISLFFRIRWQELKIARIFRQHQIDSYTFMFINSKCLFFLNLLWNGTMGIHYSREEMFLYFKFIFTLINCLKISDLNTLNL